MQPWLQRKSLILDMHIMVNWHMLKQGIHRPVSPDYIAGSSFKVIEVRCFFLVDRCPKQGKKPYNKQLNNLERSVFMGKSQTSASPY